MNERRRARPRWAVAAAVLSGLLLLLTPLNERLSQPLRDWQLRRLAPVQPPAGVLVVDIDDASLATLKPHFGAWPYKRDVYALAIESLRGLGARAIAFDLLLVDAQPADEVLARTLARPGAPVMLAAAGLRHAGDGVLSGAVGHGALPSSVDHGALPAATGTAALNSVAGGAVRPSSSGATGAQPGAPAYVWSTMALPAQTVWPGRDQPPPLGVITTPLDSDGVLRRLPLWHEAAGQRWPVLPLAMLHLTEPDALARRLPHDDRGAVHFAFGAAPAAPPVLRLSTLLLPAAAGEPPDALRERVRGQVVFIGSSALLGDAVMTVQGQASGTLVLAQAYAALRDSAWVRPAADWANAALLGVALLPSLWTLRRRRVRPLLDTAAAGAALLVCGTLAALWLAQLRMPTLWAAPLAALLVGLAGTWLLYAWQQAAARRRLAHDLAVTAEATRAKNLFLANVSHEIRTPLNALLGVAELLSESRLTPTQQHQVHLFQEAGHTLHALIDDLLDLSRIEAGGLELEVSAFSLHALLQRQSDLMRPHAERKGLRLELELLPGLPDGVRGDRMRLQRALSNLLGNAVKFTAQGQVRLRAGPDTSAADGVCLEVIDTGIGIAPSKLETIFEPFSQADSSVTRNYGGTGLGLTLTRSVAQLMGGSVVVHSTPGAGSRFVMRVPLPAAALPDAAAPAAGPALALAADAAVPRKVLLAEDNEVNTYIFCAMLADAHLHIDTAPNGLVALELLRSRSYDIAFIDVQMPGLDGLSLTRQLRQWEAAQGAARTPVVSLTANAFESDVQASLDAGCDHHLAKPFAKSQLLAMVQQLATRPAANRAPDGVAALARPAPADALLARASQGGDAPATAQVAPAAGPALVLDAEAARRRLGFDAAQYRRVLDHARVFIEDWSMGFDRARAGDDPVQALRLVHDLKSVASTLGASALAEDAAALEAALRCAPPERVDAARARLQLSLTPVIVALTARPPA